MNSWKSTLLSACAPPFRMFIIGTGRIEPAAPSLLLVEPREVRVERHARRERAGARQRHRDAEQRVRAQPSLGGRAVERDHRRVDRALIRGLARERRGDLAVDVGDRLLHALAEVALLVAVAQLERFPHARRGARRHRRPPHDAAVQRDVHFHRRIAARIENLSAVYRRDFHQASTLQISRFPNSQIPRFPNQCDPRSSNSASIRSASSLIGPMNGLSSLVTTTMPLSLTVWRWRSSSSL